MKLLLAFALLLLSACPNSAYRGAFVIAQNPKYTLNTQHTCEAPEEALRLAELAMPLILQELERDGVIADYAAAVRQLAGKTMVCRIPAPEPCCMNRNYCAKPQQPGGGRYARKAGCTILSSVWYSETWPPICRPDWPSEPHCDAVEPYDKEATLVHELINVVVSMVGDLIQPDYKHKIWEPGGTEARIQAAFKVLRGTLN